MNVNEQIIRPLLGFASTIALFLIPMITMRLFAEEKKHRHHRAAADLAGDGYRDHPGQVAGRPAAVPVRAGDVGAQHRAAVRVGQAGPEAGAGGYLGLILQGGCLLAIGAFISTTTRNQIIAGGVTFFVCLLLWLLSWFTAFDSPATAQVVDYLSIVTHFENFGKGVLDSKDVVFYLSMIFFGLFLTSRSMESLRWRA